jgi:hypothetical protein
MKPVPAPTLRLMFSDLAPGQGEQIVDALVEEGMLERDGDGAVFSPRAMREAEKAFAAWQGKRRGGLTARGVAEQEESSGEADKSGAAKLQDTSGIGATERERDRERERDSPNGEETPPTPSMVVEAWNEVALANGLSQVAKMTDERTKRLKARIADHGSAEIIAGIKTIPESAFLMGENDRGWKANFDWMLRPDMCAKLLEGAYHNKKNSSAWAT